MAFPPSKQRLFDCKREEAMTPDDEKILKVAKEVLIKFIELGRVSPANFDEHFRSVFWTLKNTLVSAQLPQMDISSTPKDSSED